jgi:hypothetical protein
VRGTLGSLAVVAACGGAHGGAHHAPPSQTVRDAGVIIDAAIEAGPSKLELLGRKHDRLAPGMREITRTEIDLERDHALSLPAFEADTCVRAAFDADAKGAVMLEDARAMTLATVDGAEGVLGAAGPVCFRKADVATFRFTGQSHLRLVVWVSP